MGTTITNIIGINPKDLPSDPSFDEARLGMSINPDSGAIYKTTVQDWVELLTGLGLAYAGAADTDTDPGTPDNPVYYTASTAGTYTNFKDSTGTELVIADDEIFAILSFDGTAWTKQIISFPQPENKIDDWVSDNYDAGQQVNHNGQIWKAKEAITSSDEPGVSDKWVPMVDALLASDYIAYSANLIDNSKVVSGGYNSSNGTVFSSNDSIRTPLIPIDASEGKISITGVGATINSFAARFAFYDADQTYLSYSNNLVNVDIPADAAFVGITIAYTAGIGNDPTNSVYKDKMIASYGSTVTEYEPYGSGFNANKILLKTLDEAIQETDAFGSVKNFTDTIKYQTANLFEKSKAQSGSVTPNGDDGASSANWVRSAYISIDPDKKISSSGHWNNVSTSLAVAFYDSNKTFISGLPLAGQTIYTTTSPANAAFVRFTIGNIVDIGSNPTDNTLVNSFMVNYGEPIPWEPGPDQPRIDGTKIYGLDIPDADGEDVYVSFDPTGFSGKELFTVYVRRQGKGNHYVGFNVGHAYDMSDLVYQDQWRIIVANEYTFDGLSMTQVDTGTLAQVESECVYMPIHRTYPKADFAGGVHGDEIYSKFKFLIDGLPVTDLTTAFTMKGCKKASYIQYSQIHEPPDVIDGVDTPVAGHPVECDHVKHTVFGDGGYTTYNTLIWAGDKPNFWYHGICCMGKMQAANGFDEDFQELTFTGSLDQTNLKPGNREFNYYNSTNKLSAHITSTLYAKNLDDSLCQMFIWDRATDSKYYRKTTDNASTEEGEVYKSIMQVTFKQEG